jgi:hypothetical protein
MISTEKSVTVDEANVDKLECIRIGNGLSMISRKGYI